MEWVYWGLVYDEAVVQRGKRQASAEVGKVRHVVACWMRRGVAKRQKVNSAARRVDSVNDPEWHFLSNSLNKR